MVFQVRKYENSMEKYPQKVEVFEAWKQSFQNSSSNHFLACTPSFSHPLIELLGAFWFWSILNRDVGLSRSAPLPPRQKKKHTN